MSVRETGLYYLQSRYYNPTWGRFLNADALVSTGQGILGNNMYAYCLNRPVNYVDGNGLACHTFGIGLPGAKAFSRITDNGGGGSKDSPSTATVTPTGVTLSYGTAGSFSLGSFIFSAQICLSVDGEGNVELQGAVGDGFTTGTVGGALMSFITITNAPKVDSLRGMGCQAGAIISDGLGVGLDANFIENPKGDDYGGFTLSGGMATPDAHIIMEYTFPIISIPSEFIEILNDAYYAMLRS